MSFPAFAGIKACVFDAYGTLFDVHSAVAHAGDSLGDKAGIVSDLWRQKQLEYTWLRSLMGAHADFWQVTRDALDFAMTSHDVADPALQERLMELYLSLDAYPEVAATLARLQEAGYATAILSNGAPKMLSAAVESAGLSALLNAVFSIEDVGIFKPDPRVYQLAVDRLNVAPQEICFLSSNGWDAAAAGNFGFHVAWVNRFNKQQERIPTDPDIVIRRLDELPPLLGIA